MYIFNQSFYLLFLFITLEVEAIEGGSGYQAVSVPEKTASVSALPGHP